MGFYDGDQHTRAATDVVGAVRSKSQFADDLGHLGQCIPFNIWRIDNIVAKAPRGIPCKRKHGEYFRENVYVTTSGNFRTPSLLSTVLEVGSDRILDAIDYPFESFEDGSRWFDHCEIIEPDRKKICRGNARRLFGLP